MNETIPMKIGKLPLRIVGPFSDIRTRAEVYTRASEYHRIVAARPIVE